MTKKTIFQYSSYRQFLQDHFENEKNSTRSMTLGSYAKLLGISTSGLNMILKGHRKMTIENIHLFAKYLKLSRTEHDYFEALVLSEQAEDRLSKRYYSSRLKVVSANAKLNNVHVNERYLLSNWYVPALLIYLMDIKHVRRENLDSIDYEDLSRRFQISKATLQDLVRKFRESGFVDFDQDGKMHIVFDQVTAKVPQIQYIKAVHKEVEGRIEKQFPDTHSIFRAFTFSIHRDSISDLKRDLVDLFEKYMTQFQVDSPNNVVVQSLVSLFRVDAG